MVVVVLVGEYRDFTGATMQAAGGKPAPHWFSTFWPVQMNGTQSSIVHHLRLERGNHIHAYGCSCELCTQFHKHRRLLFQIMWQLQTTAETCKQLGMCSLCEHAHTHTHLMLLWFVGRTPLSVYKLVSHCWLQLFNWKSSSSGSNYNHGRKKIKGTLTG